MEFVNHRCWRDKKSLTILGLSATPFQKVFRSTSGKKWRGWFILNYGILSRQQLKSSIRIDLWICDALEQWKSFIRKGPVSMILSVILRMGKIKVIAQFVSKVLDYGLHMFSASYRKSLFTQNLVTTLWHFNTKGDLATAIPEL